MTIRSEIRAAIDTGKKTAEAILDACPGIKIRKQLLDNLYVLKGEGKLKTTITDNVTHWGVASWPEKTTNAPPQQRKASKPPKRKTGKPRKAKPAAALPAAPVADAGAFPPSLTVDKRLVLVGMSPAPQIFTPEQTLAIADLVLDQFEPA